MLPPEIPPLSDRERERQDEGPDVRSIGRTLTTPALSGLVLTRDRIGDLAANLSLPVGFSERSQMLVNMLRAAAELDRLPALIRALGAEVERWETRYSEWAAQYPASAPIWDEWRGRLARTRRLLDDMLAAVESPGDEPRAGL